MEGKNIIIVSTEESALVYVDGKIYGDHILSVDFHKEGREQHELKFTSDIPVPVPSVDVNSYKEFVNKILSN